MAGSLLQVLQRARAVIAFMLQPLAQISPHPVHQPTAPTTMVGRSSVRGPARAVSGYSIEPGWPGGVGKARCKLKAVPPRLLSTLTDRFLHGVCCRAPSALASPCCISQPGDREDRPMIPCLGAISPWWCGRQGSGGGGLPAMVGDEPGDSSTAILGEQRHTGSQADA